MAQKFTSARYNSISIDGTLIGHGGMVLPIIPPGDTFATNTGTATFQNKTLDDSNCQFGDHTDITKQATFNLSGATTGTKLSLVSSQTVNRSITLPDATDQVVCRNTVDTLTNKTLTSPGISSPTFSGTAVGPLSITGSISSSSTISGTQGDFTAIGNQINLGTIAVSGVSTLNVNPPGSNNTNTYNLPTTAALANTTLVGDTTIQTLTNKTLTSPAINTATITDGTFSSSVGFGGDLNFTSGGIKLTTNGGTPSLLVYYEERSVGLLSATQPWAAAQTVNFTMKKHNSWVTLTWADMTATATGAAKITFTIDQARYKPASNFNAFPTNGQDNSNPVIIGMVINASSGVITFSVGTTGANFTNTGTAAVFSGSVSYLST